MTARSLAPVLGLPGQYTTYTCPHSTQLAGWMLARQCLTCSRLLMIRREKARCIPRELVQLVQLMEMQGEETLAVLQVR